MREFRRSGRFGLIGVFVVMAVVAVIALTLGSNSASPTTAFILIFGVIGAFFVILFVLQRRDIDHAAGADLKGSMLGPQDIADPTTVDEPTLWAAMAVNPIDDAAIKARGEMWEAGRRGINTGILITALIFVSVPPIYIFGTWIPFIIGAPLIVGIALYKSARIMIPGGDVDQAYESADAAMAPLGLHVTEHPKVVIETKGVTPYRMGPGMRGTLLMEGERHGRQVTVSQPTSATGTAQGQVMLAAPVKEFHATSRDGRLHAPAEAPPALGATLQALSQSELWDGVDVQGSSDGIVITRRGNVGYGWLRDLWLAERLADELPS